MPILTNCQWTGVSFYRRPVPILLVTLAGLRNISHYTEGFVKNVYCWCVILMFLCIGEIRLKYGSKFLAPVG